MSNPVQADRENRETIQTVVIANGRDCPRVRGLHAEVHRGLSEAPRTSHAATRNQPDPGTISDRWRGFMYGNRL